MPVQKSPLKVFAILIALAAIAPSHASSPSLTPDEMVRRADLIRVPDGSYEIDITVTDYVGQENRGEKTYRSMVKDLDHALVTFLTPTTERGKSMLMLQEDVWVYLPNIKKPVRVPLRQRLLGQVAVGDMVRTNFSNDYNAALVGEDQFEGTPAYVLDLKAKSPSKAYQQIKYWVAKESYRPLFAEYFSASGTSLKTLTFKEYKLLEGTERPSLGVFQDSLQKEKITHMRFDKVVRKPFQDMIFTKQYMHTLD
jgi:outer membrane lipoprotein-sorting protein